MRNPISGLRRLTHVPRGQLLQRAALRIYRATNASSLHFPLLPEDVADSTAVATGSVRPEPVPRDRPLRVGWVTTPPGPGSGGHTTLFRMVEAMEQRGHRCTLFLYDRYEGHIPTRAQVVRDHWPELKATIRDARDGIDEVDVVVATSWDTAHVVANSPTAVRPCYFIQDFEPFFYGRGVEYELALDSYRFGFRCIALGGMIAQLLRDEVGIEPDTVPFGCDTSVYRPLPATGPRRGVVFFARPGTPRRGYILGKLAVEAFHRMRPTDEIHIFGTATHDIEVPVINHGMLSPAELNVLYNRVVAGLSLSFTNVSLVPGEMLAAGAIPVVNESPYARICLTSPEVEWTTASPIALAQRLRQVVERDDIDAHAARAVADASGGGWAETAEALCDILEAEGRR